MEPPTSAPAGDQSGCNSNVPKLRTSCDACLIVKVKCEKTGTACKRCSATGTPCQFSPSKRRGKPPASSRKSSTNSSLGQKTPNPSIAPNVKNTPSIIARRETSPTESIASSNLMEDVDMLLPPHEIENMSNYNEGWVTDKPLPIPPNDPSSNGALFSDTSFKPTNVAPSDLTWGWDFTKSSYSSTDNNDLQWTDSYSNLLAATPGMTFTQPPLTPQSSTSSSPKLSDCMHQPQECAALALNALNCLYPNGDPREDFVFSSDAFVPQRRSSNFSSPLSAHNYAVETVQQILSCKCSLNDDVALSCMAVIYRVLGCFGNPAVATGDAPASSTSSTRSGTSSPPSLASQASSHPGSPGAPKWEKDTELVMQRVSILQEMRRVAHLFDTLAERRHAAAGGPTEGVHEILSVLSKSLRARLSTAMKEVAEMSSSLAMTYA